jgi:hypothetical protein
MPPLERLFLLEVEFHRRLRTQAPGTADARALHASYALQIGYDPLIRQLGTASATHWPPTPATCSPPAIPETAARLLSARRLTGRPAGRTWQTPATMVSWPEGA